MTSNRLELIAEMLEKNPNDTFLNYAAALEYRKDNDRPKAIRTFKKIVESDPDYLPTYYQLGKLLEEAGKNKEAIVVYRKGYVLSKKINDLKAIGELSEALLLLDADVEENW